MKINNRQNCGVKPTHWERGTPTESNSVALPKAIWALLEEMQSQKDYKYRSNALQEIILNYFDWSNPKSKARVLNNKFINEGIKNR